MNLRHLLGAASTAALFLTATAMAQETVELPTITTPNTEGVFEGEACLTMASAIEEALSFDPRIDGARAQRDIARAEVLSAYSRNMPQISAFAQTGFGDTPPLDRRRDDEIGLQLSQELYSFGQRRYAKDAAKLRYRAAAVGVQETQGEIIAGLASSYLEYARAASVLALAEEQAEAFRKEAESGERRLARRVITLTDASQLRSRAARARADLVDAREASSVALTRLEVLANQEIPCLDQASVQEFLGPEAPRVLGLAPEVAVEEALDNSPILRRARAQVASARANAGEASRAGLPTVSLTAFAQAFKEETTDAVGNATTDYDQDSRVGLNVRQELYTGGLNRARRLDAAARVRSARADEDLQRLAMDDRIRGALARALARRDASEELAEASAQAKIQFESTQREYARGTKTLTDLVLASDAYFSAASQDVSARYGFYSSLIQLYSGMGILTEDGLR